MKEMKETNRHIHRERERARGAGFAHFLKRFGGELCEEIFKTDIFPTLWKIGSSLIWQLIVCLSSQSHDQSLPESNPSPSPSSFDKFDTEAFRRSVRIESDNFRRNDKMDFDFRRNDDLLRHMVPQVDVSNDGRVLSENEGRRRRQSFIHKVIKTRIDWAHDKEGEEEGSDVHTRPSTSSSSSSYTSSSSSSSTFRNEPPSPVDAQDTSGIPSSIVNVLNDHVQQKARAFPNRKVDIPAHSETNSLSDIPEKSLQTLVSTFTDLIGRVALQRKHLASLMDGCALTYLMIGAVAAPSNIALEVGNWIILSFFEIK